MPPDCDTGCGQEPLLSRRVHSSSGEVCDGAVIPLGYRYLDPLYGLGSWEAIYCRADRKTNSLCPDLHSKELQEGAPRKGAEKLQP
jgi:hypothetical protein